MSKRHKSESQDRFFVELTKTRLFLITKRKRLFRTGETFQFQQVDKSTSSATKAWLEVHIPKSLTRTEGLHPWDRAHSLAKKLGSELAEFPYVEPESQSGQSGLFRDVFREAGNTAKNKTFDPGISKSQFDPASMIPDPLKEIKSFMGGADLFPRSLSALPDGDELSPPENVEDSIQSKSSSVTERRPSLEARKVAPGRFSFPLIRRLSGWTELPPTVARMLEVELVQLYRTAKLRARYPNLESQNLPNLSESECQEVLLSLFQMPMSRALQKLAPNRV